MHHLPDEGSSDLETTVAAPTTQFPAGLIGTPDETVRLTWRVSSTRRGSRQVGARIAIDAGDGWRPLEPLLGPDAVAVAVGDGGLPPGGAASRRYRVQVATERGWTAWSEPVLVETGLPVTDWDAQVVGLPAPVGGAAIVIRHEFDLPARVVRARLRWSALGVADARINGSAASRSVLTPGWTSYQERILADTEDVTVLLREGRNALAFEVSDGWYRGRFGFADRSAIYGDATGVIARLEVELADGSTTIIRTGPDWRAGHDTVTAASLYDGTDMDLRLHRGDPSEAGFDDGGWDAARVVGMDLERFELRSSAPVRVIAELPMAAGARAGSTTLDAGQNITGWVRLRLRGRRGDRVEIRHAEVLEADGALHTAALRTARATDTYVLAADGETVVEPRFTFHGFRHAEVTGAEVVEARAIAISSDLETRSSFSSASPQLDRFHENVVWSLRDNFVSVPTDCPQRDERLGWTGDAQVFAATASTLVHGESFWRSWLADLAADQSDERGVPSIVPDIIFDDDLVMGAGPVESLGRAGWADAATIVPWSVYRSTGDLEVLRRQLDSMRRWVAHLRRRLPEGELLLPTEPFQYGDWLDPDAPGDRPWQAKVDADYVSNAFYVHSSRLLAEAERLVGDPGRGRELDELADRTAAAVWSRWSVEALGTQTGAALALEFGIAPPQERAAVAGRLAADVEAEGGRIATGFLGTPLVLPALSGTGHLEQAYDMLLRREAPSWLYQVDRGATTVWERWDAIKEDGSIHDGAMDSGEGGSMISFNHYAYGAVLDWVYRNVAGLAPEEPGYRIARIAPRPSLRLPSASASIGTAYGELSIDWRLEGGRFEGELVVPFGVTALLDLPALDGAAVTVDGAAAPSALEHGSYRFAIDRPAVAA